MALGKWLIYFGCIFIVGGALLLYVPTLFSWFGRLPGDIRVQRENTSVFIPITSMIIVSLVLTVLLNVFGRFFSSQ